MSKGLSTGAMIGIGTGVYLLATGKLTSLLAPVTSLVSTTNPAGTQQIAAGNYGINSGIRGGNGSFYTVSNYQQLLQANPNLANPNYQMNQAELAQYLANYLDLQQGLPSWVGQKDPTGNVMSTLQRAEQVHWQYHGCAEQRIFLPLQPPSTGNYIPPPPNTQAKSSGGSSFLSSALSVAATVLPAILGDPQLNEADVNLLFTGGAILTDLLPIIATNDPVGAKAVDTAFKNLVTQYY